MRRVIALISFVLVGAAVAGAQTAAASAPPVRIILVGDSTVAPHNGWGPGFCDLLTAQVTCLNLGKNGRSSGSYRAEGSWDTVLKELKSGQGFQATYVLIQFGHNDQPGKPGRSTDLATEFPANIRHYVEDVKSAGATPVLITPLTRRSFSSGTLKNDLVPWADATRKIAREGGVPVLELNAESSAAVQKMGGVEANTLAMAPPPAEFQASAAAGDSLPTPKPPPVGTTVAATPRTPVPVFDYTHLGPKGSSYFGRMVAAELVGAVPALGLYVKGEVKP